VNAKSSDNRVRSWTEIKSSFVQLSDARKAVIIATVSFQLTVLTRNEYPEDAGDHSKSVTAMQSLNEIQHTLIGYLVSLLTDNKRRFPADVLIDIEPEKALRAGFDNEIRDSFLNCLAAK
jgi:hypothetical protein